jgi:drug/metabolite transporter (DMT)-like permease
VNACLLFVQISLLNLGARRTTGANATVLMSVYPVPLALGAHFMIPGDRLTLRRLGGFALSLLGIVAVFAHDLSLSAANWVGNLIVVSSAILLGLKEVYMKRCLVTVSRDKLVFWQALLSLPLFGAYTILAEGPDWHQCLSRAEGNNLFAAAVAIGYQGVIVVGFCFMSWAWLLARYQASKLAALTFFTPLCGMLFSHWMLGDALGPGLWLGAALVAAGVTIGATEAPEE